MITYNLQVKKWICFLCIGAVVTLFNAQSGFTADLVSGHYISSSGKTIELALEIQSPPPASLIIEQYLPPGTKIASSQPKLKKYDIKKGKAKWLLKNVRSGKMIVKLQLIDKIDKGKIRALLRCKDPATGGFIEMTVIP